MLIWTGKKSDFSGEDKEAMHVSQQGCITETWFDVPWSSYMIADREQYHWSVQLFIQTKIKS